MIDVSLDEEIGWVDFYLKSYLETGRGINMADMYEVSVVPVDEASGPRFAAIGVRHLPGTENNGNHNVYVDVIDAAGKRIWNAMVGIYSHGVGQFFARVDKPQNEPGCNHILHANVSNNTVFVSEAGYQSERVTGLKSDHPDEGPGNTRGHHSFHVVFLRLDQPIEIKPPVDPKPSEPQPPARPVISDEALLQLHDLLELIIQNQAAQALTMKRIEESLPMAKHSAAAKMLVAEIRRNLDDVEKLLSNA